MLGVGRGEEVFPMPDLPAIATIIVTPRVAVSTPEAFRAWDRDQAAGDESEEEGRTRTGRPARSSDQGKLTAGQSSDRISMFSRSVCEWLNGHLFLAPELGAAGVPCGRGKNPDRGDRAEALLLDLVRAGIENDFERVVFPEHPELREAKRVLEREGALYASLSGSGSTLYGLYESAEDAGAAAERISAAGYVATRTSSVSRAEYWKQLSS